MNPDLGFVSEIPIAKSLFIKGSWVRFVIFGGGCPGMISRNRLSFKGAREARGSELAGGSMWGLGWSYEGGAGCETGMFDG